MKHEYCYKAILNSEYILYLGFVFGKWHVFVTNENHTINYSVYGGYTHIGNASNRLIASAKSYHSNPVNYYYMSKALILKNGAFSENRKEV